MGPGRVKIGGNWGKLQPIAALRPTNCIQVWNVFHAVLDSKNPSHFQFLEMIRYATMKSLDTTCVSLSLLKKSNDFCYRRLIFSVRRLCLHSDITSSKSHGLGRTLSRKRKTPGWQLCQLCLLPFPSKFTEMASVWTVYGFRSLAETHKAMASKAVPENAGFESNGAI